MMCVWNMCLEIRRIMMIREIKCPELSSATYNQSSVAVIAVAAHECGHAIQHARGYVPLKLRGALVPVANFGSAIAWPLILLGLLFNSNSSAMFLNMGSSCIFYVCSVSSCDTSGGI